MSDPLPPGPLFSIGPNSGGSRQSSALPLLGCLTLTAALLLLCLLPMFLVDVMQTALTRLHLSPVVATLAVLGIFLGSLVNVPVYRIDRIDSLPDYTVGAFGLGWFTPQFRAVRQQTIIAVNVGGCVIPTLIAIRQLLGIVTSDGRTVLMAFLIAATNTFVCYRAARPVAGVGIMMPGFLSPLVSVGLTWLLGVPTELRAPVAFFAGISGPLIGADLLHLRDVTRLPAGVLSIGGAGTFDGIVLSGVLAALLA